MHSRATLGLMLAASIAGCGKRTDPAPPATESSSATASLTPAAREPPTPSAAASAAAEAASPSPAATPQPAASAIPVKLAALGTEPFWSARIDGTRLTYTTPEDQKGQSAAVTRHDSATGAQFEGKLGGAAVLVEVSRKACSDGMSDRIYRFTVVLTLGSDRREGCAS